MKLRRGAKEEPKKDEGQADPLAEVFKITEKYKAQTQKKAQEEGSVTNSLAMLTAIPEVDLGMEYVSIFVTHVSLYSQLCSARLKNIEETEKAKRMIAEQRKDKQRQLDDEAHLAAARCKHEHLPVVLPALLTRAQSTGPIPRPSQTRTSCEMPSSRQWASIPKTTRSDDPSTGHKWRQTKS